MSRFFPLTLFVGSSLLFLVQPMIAKMLLSRLGGSPAIWNTCMVFFQAVLLAGYAYAHAISAYLNLRRQIIVHVAVLLLPCSVSLLPIAVAADATPPGTGNPSLWLLGTLAVGVGLPFFAVSATAPLLQKWFASSGDTAATDPYYLYVSSNLGSVLALLSYPFLLEPRLTSGEQSIFWTAGYALLIVMVGVIAWKLWRMAPAPPSHRKEPNSWATGDIPLTRKRRCRWLVFAFVPSSLLFSVTTYLTSDIAAVPLLWVIPLSLYLVSFIIVFAQKPLVSQRFLTAALPRTVLLLVLVYLTESNEPIQLVAAIHLGGFFVLCLACHGELAQDRPATSHLTEFYLWLAVGGVLGGLFNALVAPQLFTSVLEYPLIVAAVAFLLLWSPYAYTAQGSRQLDWLLPAAVLTLTSILVVVFQYLGTEPGPVSIAVMFGAPVVICYTFIERPLRFALGVAAILLASSLYHGVYGTALFRDRDFFGVHRVTHANIQGSSEKYHQLVHGYTVHGLQSDDPRRRREPLTYYTRSGPIGQVFDTFSGAAAKKDVAVVGLGAGSLSAYALPGQNWTFFEIDPAVVAIAQNSQLFSYLADSSVHPRLVLGDARLSLAKEKDHHFDLLILDAFSSDSIPPHLLTREAFRLYVAKLTDDGLIAFHISNKYLDLEPVLGDVARDAGLASRSQKDLDVIPVEKQAGKFGSHWVVLARKDEHLGRLRFDRSWQEIPARKDSRVWTDDFYNLISVLRRNSSEDQ